VSEKESSDDGIAQVIQATPQGRHRTTSITLYTGANIVPQTHSGFTLVLREGSHHSSET
jgi:hypothetical protein